MKFNKADQNRDYMIWGLVAKINRKYSLLVDITQEIREELHQVGWAALLTNRQYIKDHSLKMNLNVAKKYIETEMDRYIKREIMIPAAVKNDQLVFNDDVVDYDKILDVLNRIGKMNETEQAIIRYKLLGYSEKETKDKYKVDHREVLNVGRKLRMN